MLMDLHNGTVCESSSSAERYSVDELEDEQSRTNDTMIVINATIYRQLSVNLLPMRKFASSLQATLCIQYLYPDLYNVVLCY